MYFRQILTLTSLFPLTWSSVALAQDRLPVEQSQQLPSTPLRVDGLEVASLNPSSPLQFSHLTTVESAKLSPANRQICPLQTCKFTSFKSANLPLSNLQPVQTVTRLSVGIEPHPFPTTCRGRGFLLPPKLSSDQLFTAHCSLKTVKPSNPQVAQTNLDIPPGVLEPTRPSLPPLPATPPEAPTPPPSLIPPSETPQIPPPELGVTVQVKRVEVLGSTVFSPAELEAAVASFIGKDATFEELLAIRTAITQLYTDKGYTTSGAFLPPQDVTDGMVKVQVVEGAIEKIEIEGLSRLRTSYVRSRIGLATKPPVNLGRLEEALQLLQLDSHISAVQAKLSPGTAPGLSVLTLNVKEAQPLATSLSVENRNSPSVGSIQGTAAISHNNLLGFGDRLSAEYGRSEGVKTYSISYAIPLNPRDGTLSVSYDHSSSRIIEKPFSDFDINSDSYTFSLGFRQPIVRTPTTEFALALSLDSRQSETFLFDDLPFSFSPGPENGKSKVTVLRFTQDWINRSANRVLAARSQFSFGVDALDATVNDLGIDGRFTSWLGQFQMVQALGGGAILIARTGAQLTPDGLLPIEQFSIGGIDTVRGYRQNERVADNGIVGSVEVRYPIIRSPNRIGIIQLASFFDIGTVWNNQADVSREISSSSTLASVGLGLLWQLDPYVSARLDWGIPLISVSDGGDSLQDNGISFSIRFQPF
ncbi:MAG TPA: ShlB/FhaC/HecB family hemolysin secretion/activation protein [Chroococcales cyanobacterium]